ncbi:hypothetical protein [Thauera sinica]|uniref:Alginate export domain-containing protein n=1 Tax=Thauera sinica TaxID=2665146 RepID=A0ABW1ATH9_9RHOO|nr:hypothetical protein [Thauera sp. K11]ATE58829.1 hypothetical protein CCZ27_01640 [Thauera sp. K11]
MGQARDAKKRDIVPRWDNSAGADYMVGIDLRKAYSIFVRQDGRYNLDAQTLGTYVLFQQSQNPLETDRNIVANTAFGQAANYHDVYYWYAFDLRDRAAEAVFGKRWDQLGSYELTTGVVTTGQYAGKTLLQIEGMANDVLYEADLNLIKLALQWQPTNLIDQNYRRAAIEGFIFKIQGYGTDYAARLEQDWSGLQVLDPTYQRSGLLGQAGLILTATYWKNSGLEDLTTLPLSREEMGFFTRLTNLAQPRGLTRGTEAASPVWLACAARAGA